VEIGRNLGNAADAKVFGQREIVISGRNNKQLQA
jgi:hypothetical protein